MRGPDNHWELEGTYKIALSLEKPYAPMGSI